MDEVHLRLKSESERIAARHRLPEFYVRFQAPLAMARKLFFGHPLVLLLRRRVEPMLQDDLGHGIYHCMRVSVDTAALIHTESASDPMEAAHMERLMVLGEIAGLLHDIRRSEEEHADAGAREAARILRDFPVSREEIEAVCRAIRNHEAFKAHLPSRLPWSQLLSDSLYDADKFRWGPDNFTHTLWHMASHRRITPCELIERFPWGMAGVARIQDTFRTSTGRQYGPDIIKTGVAIGKEIYRYLVQQFGDNRSA